MNQVVKVASGETIQIRTGVLQGIGAQGPVGPIGPQGPLGDQGPQGDQGPMGQIAAFSSEATIGAATPLGPDVEGLISFAAISRDDLAVITSATTWTAPGPMDLFFSIWVSFALGADAGDSYRQIELRTGATVIARASCPANLDTPTDLSITTTYRAAQGMAFQLWGKHSDTVSVGVAQGRVAIYRVGSGPQGIAGPPGGVGPIGPQGIPGPAGPDGSATSGFNTFEDLRAP